MQHTAGAPLPPHGPGRVPGPGPDPAAGWERQARPTGPPPSQSASPPQGPPVRGRSGPVPQQAPPPSPDTAGHVPLPVGGPVPAPSPSPSPSPSPVPVPSPSPFAENGTGTATLAVLLIGPAGAGKTTVARHWAQHRRVPTAHISLDDVREWVCSGFADPQTGWNDQSEAQYRLARRTCGFAARNFLANGISCILDDAVFPDRPVVGLGGWKRHVGPGLLPVVLLPGLEVVLERNAERSGNRRLSDEEVAGIHGRMAGWYGSGLPIIDNSRCDVETTARILDDVLARALKSPPAW
ncbi:ATP-binding protein [Streptomyces sp. PKU-MA01144]|uniref:AAA family ATPase n=1 Tax=Streptomyces sp. PKU-MA01144 TaxID=2729138 RepID=UPI00147D6B93|nr:AAA family ATPase [Streptomyces sp. PKU-MA01144]NNJ07706.1 ATP-binding protein [Streptomyces sp. PKU-MA01144]